MPTGIYPRISLAERFWSKVNKNGPTPKHRPELGPCWLWLGAISHGYGAFGVGRNKVKRAHRVAYELVKGGIPNGLEPDHLCRVRSCVNPDHLEPVTRLVNIMRGAGPRMTRVRRAAVVKCVNGHPFDKKNTFISRGYRVCRQCLRDRSRDYRRTRRA
jgi:hypothetical protein